MITTVEVGPDRTGSYRYRIGRRLSADRYRNAASAWHDARRVQRVNVDGRLVPADRVDDLNADLAALHARIAAYAARPEVQARWADDARLIGRAPAA